MSVRGIQSLGLLLILCALPGCTTSGSNNCGAGVCPSSRICVVELELCVRSTQLQACEGRADGSGCLLSPTTQGECQSGACVAASCGDGIVTSEEVCDDGNVLGGDGCGPNCVSREVCGNGVVDLEVGEACDCGNSDGPTPPGCSAPNSDAPGSTCSTECLLRGCGDGVVEEPEDCEQGLVDSTCRDLGYDGGALACSSNCRFDTSECTGFCGDGTRDSDEVCDGAAPATLSCVDFGFDFGSLGCSPGCVADLSECGRFGPRFIGDPLPSEVNDFVDDGRGGLVVATNGGLFAQTGTGWSQVVEGTFAGVERHESTIVAVGRDGVVARFDGASWTTLQAGTDDLTAVCVTEQGALALGLDTAWHIEGVEPANVSPGRWLGRDTKCTKEGPSIVVLSFGRALRFLDGAWQDVNVPGGTDRLAHEASRGLIAAVDDRVLVSSGGAWTELARAPLEPGDAIDAIAANQYGEVFVASRFDRWIYARGRWLRVGGNWSSTATVRTSPGGEFWVAVGSRIERVTPTLLVRGQLIADHAAWWQGDLVVAAGQELFRQNGPFDTRQTLVTMPGRIVGLSVRDAEVVVGDEIGNLAVVTADDVQLVHESAEGGLAAVSPAFAVGPGGLVLDRTKAWSPVDVAARVGFLAVHSTEDGHAVVGGFGGTVLHYDGVAWKRVSTGTASAVTAVWRAPDGGSWILGGTDGFLATYDGRTVERVATGTSTSFRAVDGTASDNIIAVGDGGVALRFDGVRWTPIAGLGGELGSVDVAANAHEVLFILGGKASWLLRPTW